ncbi:hypothetical protein [Dyella caseinilytica]|nr:hypothetical protein [Dyella caseinilytica]
MANRYGSPSGSGEGMIISDMPQVTGDLFDLDRGQNFYNNVNEM